MAFKIVTTISEKIKADNLRIRQLQPLSAPDNASAITTETSLLPPPHQTTQRAARLRPEDPPPSPPLREKQAILSIAPLIRCPRLVINHSDPVPGTLGPPSHYTKLLCDMLLNLPLLYHS